MLTRLRHKDSHLLKIFGGQQVMIESPLIQELLAERMHKGILKVLESRFGSIPQDLAIALQTIQDEAKLDELVVIAATCHDLDAFRARLQS